MSDNLRTISPYVVGYLSATGAGTRQHDGGLVRMPHQVYGDGSDAHAAFMAGVADSIVDRGPRLPTDRMSRAYPPWKII